MRKISIVTPCYNSERYIEETVRSILNQTALVKKRAELEYIVCDGGSTDGTLAIIEYLTKEFPYGRITIISEKDRGMYDALTKGLKLTTGDICAYINAGDYYSPQAFDIVLDMFEQQRVDWLTGMGIIYNENSQIVKVSLPYRYRTRFFNCGIYGKLLPFVQQETTFWKTELNGLIDYTALSKMKYAGDYYLWKQFSSKYELKVAEAYIGGFKQHRGQLSENLKAYFDEVDSITKKPNLFETLQALIDAFIWKCPRQVKKKLNRSGLYQFDHRLQSWS